MKLFYDWEFQEDGKTIIPISLGMVTEQGQYLYIVNQDYDETKATQWLRDNVLNNLSIKNPGGFIEKPYPVPQDQIGNKILAFLKTQTSERIELIAGWADYDHVCLAQRFGPMIDMPDILPWVTYDLKQWCDDLEVEPPSNPAGKHNALCDAFQVKETYEWLTKNYDHPAWTPRLRKPRLKQSDCF